MKVGGKHNDRESQHISSIGTLENAKQQIKSTFYKYYTMRDASEVESTINCNNTQKRTETITKLNK